jgi:hypothetical protein
MAADNHIPISFLHECFIVEGGLVRWCERPLDHFPTEQVWKWWNRRFQGREAGAVTKKGYRRLDLKYNGVQYQSFVHRIVWAMASEHWPIEIDHYDGNKTNNSVSNLVEVTRSENAQNTAARGYSRYKGKWIVHICIGYKDKYLGLYDTEEAARAAYLDAKKRYHQYRPIPREG